MKPVTDAATTPVKLLYSMAIMQPRMIRFGCVAHLFFRNSFTVGAFNSLYIQFSANGRCSKLHSTITHPVLAVAAICTARSRMKYLPSLIFRPAIISKRYCISLLRMFYFHAEKSMATCFWSYDCNVCLQTFFVSAGYVELQKANYPIV